MLYLFGFEKVGVAVGDLYFVDPNPGDGQEGAERGVRLEVRMIDRGAPPGSVYSALPITVERPIWRADLLESVDGEPGSHDRTHHHPTVPRVGARPPSLRRTGRPGTRHVGRRSNSPTSTRSSSAPTSIRRRSIPTMLVSCGRRCPRSSPWFDLARARPRRRARHGARRGRRARRAERMALSVEDRRHLGRIAGVVDEHGIRRGARARERRTRARSPSRSGASSATCLISGPTRMVAIRRFVAPGGRWRRRGACWSRRSTRAACPAH